MKVTALFIAVIPAVVSGWRIQLYADQSYKNIIEDRSGTVGQTCKNLGTMNKASSMHWNNGALNCNIRLFDGSGCSGTVLADAKYGDWNVPNFSSSANDKANSYKIDC